MSCRDSLFSVARIKGRIDLGTPNVCIPREQIAALVEIAEAAYWSREADLRSFGSEDSQAAFERVSEALSHFGDWSA